ncbi:MAG: hypothetical protein R2821_09665 [Flavobacteriaceae bacterium]
MIKQNPFSLYDFLGYLIPGATLIYIYLIIDFINEKGNFELESFLKNIGDFEYEEFFIFVVIAYTLGHLLSFISSVTIERYGNWKYGYPSKYLLDLKKKNYFEKTQRKENETEEDKKKRNNNKIRNRWRFVIGFFLFPMVLLDFLIGNIIGISKSYEKGLDEFLKKSITIKVSKLLFKLKLTEQDNRDNFNPNNIDFHRIVTHYAFENCKEHQFRMVNYVALYGFLRNLALIFIILFWIYFLLGLKSINCNLEINWVLFKILIGLAIASFISFMAFMKFYRRYTLEGLMLIVVDKDI